MSKCLHLDVCHAYPICHALCRHAFNFLRERSRESGHRKYDLFIQIGILKLRTREFRVLHEK